MYLTFILSSVISFLGGGGVNARSISKESIYSSNQILTFLCLGSLELSISLAEISMFPQ